MSPPVNGDSSPSSIARHLTHGPGETPLWILLQEQLSYNPNTGWLTWKVGRRRGLRAGCPHSTKKQKRIIQFNYQRYYEHRLIWFWMTKEFPPEPFFTDHKDRNSGNNRWSNLRLATGSQNLLNSTHFGPNRGIYECRPGVFEVRITHNNKRKTAIVYSRLAAKRLRNKWERELFGEFACTQR